MQVWKETPYLPGGLLKLLGNPNLHLFFLPTAFDEGSCKLCWVVYIGASFGLSGPEGDLFPIAGLCVLERFFALGFVLRVGFGLEGFSGFAMSIGGSKVFEAPFRLLWWFLFGMGCGFWLGSKVNAEVISFL